MATLSELTKGSEELAAEKQHVGKAEELEGLSQYKTAGDHWKIAARHARKVPALLGNLDPAPGGEKRAQQYDSNSLRAYALGGASPPSTFKMPPRPSQWKKEQQSLASASTVGKTGLLALGAVVLYALFFRR